VVRVRPLEGLLACAVVFAGIAGAAIREANADASTSRFYDCGRQWIARGLDVPVYVVPVRNLVYSVCQTPARACLMPPGTVAVPYDRFSIWVDGTRRATEALTRHETEHLGGLPSDHSTSGPTSCELGRPGPNDLRNGGSLL
jgi:hypothetical protein